MIILAIVAATHFFTNNNTVTKMRKQSQHKHTNKQYKYEILHGCMYTLYKYYT